MMTPKVDLSADPWLLVIDPQVIFADPDSDWCSPMFANAWGNIQALAGAFDRRVLVTRWLPTADRDTAWGEYFRLWPFADQPASAALYDLIPGAETISPHPSVDVSTFGKWGSQLWEAFALARGEDTVPPLVLCGVATDCCVISTALPAGDHGVPITIATDACAGSSPENQANALRVMNLLPPHISLHTTQEVIASLPA